MTQQAQHTPGEWKREGNAIYALNKSGVNRMYISIHQHGIYDDNGKTSFEETEANARLIAAAPKMLEMLKLVLKLSPKNIAFSDDIRAIVAEATGEARS